MKSESANVHALMLFSGGVDSQLALCLLRDQGVSVRAVTFSHPLCAVVDAKQVAAQWSVEHRVEDISSALIKALERTGPSGCRDGAPCQILHAEMLRRAKGLLREYRCHFLVTGETLSDRFPWQTVEGFAHMDRSAGCEGLVVRPLSAKLLAETEPERQEWIRRDDLGAFKGRCEKERLRLAGHYKIVVPEGRGTECCILNETFARRVEDLKQHEGLSGTRVLQWLRMGRHFRVGERAKLILGRNEKENAELEGRTELYDLLLRPENVRGPAAILPFTASQSEIRRAAAICVRYSDAGEGDSIRVRVRSAQGASLVEARPASPEEIERCRVH